VNENVCGLLALRSGLQAENELPYFLIPKRQTLRNKFRVKETLILQEEMLSF
jgi:hypothetical protein